MTTAQKNQPTATGTETGSSGRPDPLLLVVGYDGRPSSRQALIAAARMIHGRSGHLAVVFVEHLPGSVALSAEAIAGTREAQAQQAQRFEAEVRSLLDDNEPRWHFDARSGSVPDQLAEAAAALRTTHGPAAIVGIVVGSSMHRYHQLVGSVPVALARSARYPVLVVPWVDADGGASIPEATTDGDGVAQPSS